MTATTRLERDLSTWLSETAMPQTPDYANDILATTSRTEQRPRWTFLGRWLPLGDVGIVRPAAGGTALRGIALLIVLGLLIAAIVAFAGSRQKAPPPPFGPAGNGLIAYDQAGSIFLVHPDRVAPRLIVAGAPGENHHPRWSLDGTRLVFIRESGRVQVLVVVDAAGLTLATSAPFIDVDSDSLMWSPDGTHIAIGAVGRLGRAIYLVDAGNGTDRDLGVDYDNLEMYWRPPDGRDLLFQSNGPDPGLSLVSVVDGTVRRVAPREVDGSFRPLGWTPDGRAILYQTTMSQPGRTFVLDVETGDEIELDVTFGHLSNDGTRVAGLDAFKRPCVVAITGGRCTVIPRAPAWEGTTSAGVTWSPDDRWIAISARGDAGSVWLLDPTGAIPPRQLVGGDSGSWQRATP